jgi:TRAP-type uncharacterized transport system substrate-binding protein
MLWEIGLHVAADPTTPYGGPRDVQIVVGNGSGDQFTPRLRLATGSPILAHAVVNGELEAAMINPGGLLTQAYRGRGLFSAPLPVRVLAVYPSWDRFVYLVHPRTGLTSLSQIRERHYPLRLSIREDPTHSTRVLVDQTLAAYGFSLADLESWGGSFQLNGPPADSRRMQALRDGTIDAIFDEGIRLWLDDALAAGLVPLELDADVFAALGELGWRKVTLPAGSVLGLTTDYACVDYSGWPLYTRASLPDDEAYRICAAIEARADEIAWEESFSGMDQLGSDTEATPLDVPLHPGAARWYAEHAGQPAGEYVRRALEQPAIGSKEWYNRPI